MIKIHYGRIGEATLLFILFSIILFMIGTPIIALNYLCTISTQVVIDNNTGAVSTYTTLIPNMTLIWLLFFAIWIACYIAFVIFHKIKGE